VNCDARQLPYVDLDNNPKINSSKSLSMLPIQIQDLLVSRNNLFCNAELFMCVHKLVIVIVE
jgi:hypothetical protein